MLRLVTASVCALTLAAPLAAQAPAAARARTIRTQRLMSTALGDVRTFGLLLPRDYDQNTRRYPVIYLLHGSGQQHSTWGRQALLANSNGAIVVMPDLDRARYVRGDGSVDSRYDAFVTHELVDYIDRTYRTIAVRESRAIGGLSIGGFGAMLLGLTHADRFGAIGAFSAPFDAIGEPAALLARSPAPRPALYIGCGTADPLIGSSRRFAALLQEEQIAHHFEEGPGAHTWDAWDWQLRAFLAMLGWSA